MQPLIFNFQLCFASILSRLGIVQASLPLPSLLQKVSIFNWLRPILSRLGIVQASLTLLSLLQKVSILNYLAS